ncbi:MAG: RIP metalloprotease RseP [Candidatus Ancaeobacter aquaticus]|nr:RIP metalloprotease RseP [Candidatus Ancaeobacter aquaticus]
MVYVISLIFVLGVIVFIHELGHFIVAKLNGVRVEKFSLGFGPKLVSIKRGHTEYLICALPLGGYVKMAGDEPGKKDTSEPYDFFAKKPFARIAIVAAGPIMNVVLACVIFSGIFFVGMPVLTSNVGSVKKDYPAQIAGLLQDDNIIAVNGTPVKKWDELVKLIYPNAGKELAFTVTRKVNDRETEVVIPIIPRAENIKDIFGREHNIGVIGITPSMVVVKERRGFFGAIKNGVTHTVQLTGLTYKGIWMIATRQLPASSMGGPIFIAQLAGETAKKGILNLFNFMAVLSVSLAVINMLPIPVLDGGHIMFYTFELVKGKPISFKAMDIAQRVGLTVLIALMVFVTFNDIKRFF